MQEQERAPDQRREGEEPPTDATGPLEGAPVDGVTADNPAHPKAEPGRDPPRPSAR